MNEIIEIRMYDEGYTKIFQSSAKVSSKKEITALKKLLLQKGVSFDIGKFTQKDTEYF